MSSGEPGHFVVRHGAGDWRCACGTSLSGGPLGPARKGARDYVLGALLDAIRELVPELPFADLLAGDAP